MFRAARKFHTLTGFRRVARFRHCSGAAEASCSSSGGVTSIAKRHPFAFQVVLATGKTAAADLITQTVVEGKSLEDVDWRRNTIFVMFGFFYLGGFQYWLMVNKYRQWFPTMDTFGKLPLAEKLKDTAGMLEAVKMVVFDVCVHMPMIYFPTYYTLKEFVSGKSWNPIDWLRDGVTKYAGNFVADYKAVMSAVFPADCIQFVLPVHIRMPFRHVISFFWTSYVSFTRGSTQKNVKPKSSDD
eukprot:TRINITY_DN24145_c0_g1_i1.p1 TRINITY_DN24145_c0_g1~~TRINITY_DN24145_c0_g1_i1.p1  ORF type:complete len:241 (+),score=22.93 TRINITY_DN24145_c0_g1_i1:114-836(+)